jgi:hypothetical protein
MAANPTELQGIKFINEKEQTYFAEAVIGEEVRAFLVSDVGRYLHGCAKQEFERCRGEMFDFDPYTPEGKKRYEALKADAWAALHFMKWCTEAIQTGDNAETMMKQMQEERR